MGHFVLRPKAIADLDEIWAYSVARWGVARSDRYIGEIRSIVEAVAENPKRGRQYDDVGHFKIQAGSHLVIYLIVEGGIDVMRILHQRMDIKRHLKPPLPA